MDTDTDEYKIDKETGELIQIKTKTKDSFLPKQKTILPKSNIHILLPATLRGKRYLIDTKNDYAYHMNEEKLIEDFAGMLDRANRRVIHTSDEPSDAWTNVPKKKIDPYLLKKLEEPDSDEELPIQLRVLQERMKHSNG